MPGIVLGIGNIQANKVHRNPCPIILMGTVTIGIFWKTEGYHDSQWTYKTVEYYLLG